MFLEVAGIRCPLPPDRIGEAAILTRCLPAVAWTAERLPVRFVPEECPITLVRDDMVNHCRRGEQAIEGALFADRMFL